VINTDKAGVDREDQDRKCPETEIRGTLQDNAGTLYPYTLTICGELHDWRVFDRERRIGYAWCILAEEEFKLMDWKFENEVVFPRSFWARLLGRSPEIRNFRRRGLGNRLLPLLVDHARESGARRVTGMISSEDLEEFPTLADWYGRLGFTFVPAASAGRIMGHIELRL